MNTDWKHGGDIYTDGLLQGKELLDFSSNINPLGVPKNVKDNMDKALESLIRYPDYKYRNLKEAIINYHKKYEHVNLENENIILGNGASEILEAFIKLCEKIVIPIPSFSEYEDFAIKNNIEVHLCNLDSNMNYLYEEIKKLLNKCDGLILGNPNNPTGSLINKEKFISILELAREKNAKVIVDEAFVEFCDSGISLTDLLSKYDNLFIVRAVTKFFGMPGIRVGYGLSSNKEVLNEIRNNQLPWNINSFGEVATINSFSDEEYILESKNWIRIEKEYMYNQLKRIDIFEEVYEPSCNFILCKLKEDNNKFYEFMKSNGILIRKAGNFKGLDNRYVRFAIKDREKNNELLNNISLF